MYALLGGRSMTAFWALFLVGSVLAFRGQLHSDYVAMAATLHGFVIVRAVSEDKYLQGKSGGACATAPAEQPNSDASNEFDKTELKGD
jgi:hypothetical protein